MEVPRPQTRMEVLETQIRNFQKLILETPECYEGVQVFSLGLKERFLDSTFDFLRTIEKINKEGF